MQGKERKVQEEREPSTSFQIKRKNILESFIKSYNLFSHPDLRD